MTVRKLLFATLLLLTSSACSDLGERPTLHDAGVLALDAASDALAFDGSGSVDQQKLAVAQRVYEALLPELDNLQAAVMDLQAAAPSPTGRGWDATLDATAIANMRAAWLRARVAYERLEGTLIPLFPQLDVSFDGRYDAFLATIGAAGDAYLFDEQGVTGLHAQERILWATDTRAGVVAFEASLPGYKPSAYPATEQEAADFKNELSAKVVSDAAMFKQMWSLSVIDVSQVFRGVVGLMEDQRGNVNKASSSEEESRYSQTTMADIRSNLEGATLIYDVYSPWIASKSAAADAAADPDGLQTDRAIQAGLAALAAFYATVPGPGMPSVPVSWSSEDPSLADLVTPFGQLWTTIRSATNSVDGPSVVIDLNHAAALVGLSDFEPGGP